ncbi:GNAT family N-acetyltransferase [Luteolibacter flavescens]|uniref:GNAT family N-acetyltransferase n=1 Tax=Luteolibacter flavescens TaxID=1859460 RepID=A0ABT3FIC1_9BACT|nr:GNAT family N-acetyltransferase [Luteolibacter flavescens]MCW1883318.1 GNAT family N-acetyltransferase [Luteolibacter flavescens]
MKTLNTVAAHVIETERLQLRAPNRGDLETYLRLAGDPRVALKTTGIPHPLREADANEWLARANYGTRRTFVIARKEDAGMIGAVHLETRPDRVSAEAGLWIGVPYWRRGYATEALRGILRDAFGERGLLYITTGIPTGNPAAERVLRKAGLKFESLVEGGFRREGIIQDRVNHGLFADEWEALHC